MSATPYQRQIGSRVGGRRSSARGALSTDAQVLRPARMAEAVLGGFFRCNKQLVGIKDGANTNFVAPFRIMRDEDDFPMCALVWRSFTMNYTPEFPPPVLHYTVWRDVVEGVTFENITVGEPPNASDSLYLLFAVPEFT